jgi:hypothetical protein
MELRVWEIDGALVESRVWETDGALAGEDGRRR